METVFFILLAAPLVLWGLGGFKLYELTREFPKVIGWYVVVGGLYFVLV